MYGFPSLFSLGETYVYYFAILYWLRSKPALGIHETVPHDCLFCGSCVRAVLTHAYVTLLPQKWVEIKVDVHVVAVVSSPNSLRHTNQISDCAIAVEWSHSHAASPGNISLNIAAISSNILVVSVLKLAIPLWCGIFPQTWRISVYGCLTVCTPRAFCDDFNQRQVSYYCELVCQEYSVEHPNISAL